MFRLFIIALLVFGVGGLGLAQEKEQGPDPRLVALQQDKDKEPPPKVEPPKAEPVTETFVETPHWLKRVPLALIQLAILVIIAALLALAVGQLSGLKASIDKLAEKSGGGGS